MLDLNEEAERIRATLTALGIGRPSGLPGPAGRSLLTSAQFVLGEIAAALTGRPGQRAVALLAARRELAEAEAESAARWQWAGEALLTQLRAACQITERLNEAEPGRRERAAGGVPGIGLARFRDMMLTLRASLGTSSEAGRHALRLAVVTALAEVIVRAIGLPHGYWGVLTIFIVLRPDYSSTLYRGLQRAAGTVVGAGLGLATVQLERIGLGALLAGVAASLLAAYAVFTVNYLLYAVFLTDFVVVLLVLLGQPAEATALARLAGTGIGTGLALLAYLFWPTWAGSSASEKLARLLTLQGRYAAALLRAYTRPGEAGSAEIASLRLAVRRARIDADASADRLAGEPDHPPMTGELARSLTSAGHRIAQATITLTATLAVHHAGPRQGREAAPPDGDSARDGRGPARAPHDAALQPPLDQLAADVVAATELLASALHQAASAAAPPMSAGSWPVGSASPGEEADIPPLPQLRLRQQQLWQTPETTADGRS